MVDDIADQAEPSAVPKPRKSRTKLIILIVLVCIILLIAISVPSNVYPGDRHCRYYDPGPALMTFRACLEVFKKKGYAETGRIYPHGIGGVSTNRGKYCGLYYEVNNGGERVNLVGIDLANADCRADGDTDANQDMGCYIPVIRTSGPKVYQPRVSFASVPKQGYWFGLCMKVGTTLYNGTYARQHFGLVAFPDDYGQTGESTFVINEEGVVYALDRGKAGKYLDTFPGSDPVAQGWTKTGYYTMNQE